MCPDGRARGSGSGCGCVDRELSVFILDTGGDVSAQLSVLISDTGIGVDVGVCEDLSVLTSGTEGGVCEVLRGVAVVVVVVDICGEDCCRNDNFVRSEEDIDDGGVEPLRLAILPQTDTLFAEIFEVDEGEGLLLFCCCCNCNCNCCCRCT